VRKIFDVNYWWPTMNKDVLELCRTFDLCQQTSSLLTQNMAKLTTTLPKKLFRNGIGFH
jgi:hypothetical protein